MPHRPACHSWARVLALVAVPFLLLVAIPARAELSGYLEYGYSTNDSTSRDSVSGTTSSTSSSFSQRYTLGVSQNIYPLLRVSAGATYDVADSTAEAEGVTTRSNATRLNSHADLSFGNQYLASGFGYSQRTERPAKTTSEVYSGRLTWRPDGMPTLNVTGSRLLSYDFDRTNNDSVNDALSVNTTFAPLKGLDLGYSALLTRGENRISSTTTEATTHSFRASYGGQFWDGRFSAQTGYNITLRESSARSDTGTLPPEPVAVLEGRGESLQNPVIATLSFLNDLEPLSTASLAIPVTGAATAPLQLVAVRFDQSGRVLRPTTVRLAVSREFDDLRSSNPQKFAELESLMVAGISWFSSDSGDGDWTALPTVTYQGFKTYFTPTNEPVHVMEFAIAPATAPYSREYLMFSFRPVSSYIPPPGVDLARFTVSGLLAYAESVAGSSARTDSSTAGAFDLATRLMLLREPDLSYDFSLRLNHDRRKGYGQQLNYMIMNGLGLHHRFDETLTGSAHLRREDSETGEIKSGSTGWGAGVSYLPIQTLSFTTSYSGRTETIGGLSSSSHALSLANSADLYRGVSLGLNFSAATQTRDEEIGETTSDTMGGSAGLTLQPHRTLTVSTGFSESHQWQKRSGRAKRETFNRSVDTSLGFNPLLGLYFSGAVSYSVQSDAPSQTTMSFGGSWAPFRDGALQVSISYREGMSSFGDNDRAFTQSLRWNIRPGTYLDIGHNMQWSENDSSGTSTESEGYTANLRIAL